MSDISTTARPQQAGSDPRRSWLPSPLALLLLLAAAAVLAYVPFTSDLFWRLKSGWWLLYHLDVPRQNLYSFAATEHPWLNHEWLSDLALFWLLDRLGLAWLELARALLYLGALSCTASLLRARGGLLPTACLVFLTAGTLLSAVPQEPLLAGCFLLAVLLWLLERQSQHRLALLLVIPSLIGLWSSLHGSAIVGLALLWLWAIGFLSDARHQRQGRRALLSLLSALLATLASLVNPYFTDLHYMAGEELWQLFGSSSARLQALDAWQLAVPLAGGIGGLLLVLLAGTHAQRRLYLPWMFLTPLAAVLPGYLGLWGILSAVMAMEHFQQVVRRIRHERRGLFDTGHPLPLRLRGLGDRLRLLTEWESQFSRGFYLFLGASAACILWPLRTPSESADRTLHLELPVPGALPSPLLDAIGALVTPQTRLLAPIHWNNQLLWMGYPELHIFMDSRENAWPLTVVEDYDRVRTASPGWEEVLTRYEINLIVWPESEFIPRALETQGGWKTLLRQAGVWVLEREERPGPSPTAATPAVSPPAPSSAAAPSPSAPDVPKPLPEATTPFEGLKYAPIQQTIEPMKAEAWSPPLQTAAPAALPTR